MRLFSILLFISFSVSLHAQFGIEGDYSQQTINTSVVSKSKVVLEFNNLGMNTTNFLETDQTTAALRYGIFSNTEFRVDMSMINGFLAANRDPSFGPLNVGLKTALLTNNGMGSNLSMLAMLSIPRVGDVALRPRFLQPNLGLAYSIQASPSVRFSANGGVVFRTDELVGSSSNIYYSAMMRAAVTDFLSIFGEFFGNSPEITDLGDTHRYGIQAGIGVYVSENIQLNAAYQHRLVSLEGSTNETTADYVRFGLAFRL